MAQRVVDHGDLRKYRTEIPNIVFSLGLTPYELALYCLLKKTAGADGMCWKSTATLAKESGMSSGMVSKAKVTLQKPIPILGKPLIVVDEEPNQKGGKPKHCITLTDIWPDNTRMRGSSSPHEVGAETSSYSEVASSPHERSSSPHEIKKEPIEEGTNEEKDPSAHARLFNFLSKRIGPIPNGGKEGKAIKWLLDNGYEPEQCEACFEFLVSEDWRTTAVTWTTVKSQIGAWLLRTSTGGNGLGSRPQTASQRNVTNIKDGLEYLEKLKKETNGNTRAELHD